MTSQHGVAAKIFSHINICTDLRWLLQTFGNGARFGEEIPLRLRVRVLPGFVMVLVLPQPPVVVHICKLGVTFLEHDRVVRKIEVDLKGSFSQQAVWNLSMAQSV